MVSKIYIPSGPLGLSNWNCPYYLKAYFTLKQCKYEPKG